MGCGMWCDGGTDGLSKSGLPQAMEILLLIPTETQSHSVLVENQWIPRTAYPQIPLNVDLGQGLAGNF